MAQLDEARWTYLRTSVPLKKGRVDKCHQLLEVLEGQQKGPMLWGRQPLQGPEGLVSRKDRKISLCHAGCR